MLYSLWLLLLLLLILISTHSHTHTPKGHEAELMEDPASAFRDLEKAVSKTL